MHLPFSMSGFTDYTCSLEHVVNVSSNPFGIFEDSKHKPGSPLHKVHH